MNGNISENQNISEKTINTGVSPAFIEKILGLGLSTMSVEAQKERMERVVSGVDMKSTMNTVTTIDGQALAVLIDESRDALRLLMEGNITEQQCERMDREMLDEVKSMLASIDGKKAVASMDPDALVDLVMEYWRSVK